MDVNLLSNRHALALVLAVGDRPGQTVRRLTSNQSGSPVKSAKDHLMELVEAGVFRTEESSVRGLAAVRVYLTERGTTLYNLLVVIRGL